MNVGELLDNWKNDSTWVYDASNPFGYCLLNHKLGDFVPR